MSTGAQAQTAKTADAAPVSTGAPATMATIANPAPGSTVAQAQTPTTAKPKPKLKKSKPVAAAAQAPTVTAADPPPVPGGPLGCCEGGSATGANAWTDGNYTAADWPANPAPATGMIIGKAPPAADTGWWTHGELEVGGRGFTNAPSRNGTGAYNSNVWQQGQNLAKYYEYSDIAPGVFGGGHVATGSKDGLYQVDLWANNVGYLDQSYLLSASKAGEQYFTATWDQSPHLYSTTAQTPYVGVGGYNLTVPAQTATLAALVAAGELHQTDLGIKRDTAAGTYRWTPTDAWDFNVEYSNMHRSGEQPYGGVIGIPTVIADTTTPNYVMVPTPVHDTTQNYAANGEYVGTSFWGQRYTVKLGYQGSTYHDNSLSYTVENPLTGPGGIAAGIIARESMWPSNQANGFVSTTSADLPWQSRYVGSVNYTSMTQNSPFIPMSANFAGAANSVNPLPANSLNGEINTLLSNNVLTTKVSPQLTNKITYRYYNFDNETPQILFNQWISDDHSTCCGEGAMRSLTMKYTKQDAGDSLNWRPNQYWNFNGGYVYERYDWTQADASATNENTGNISADYKPFTWLTARTSGALGYRRAENYNYFANVWSIQVPSAASLPAVCGPGGAAQCVQETFGYQNAQRQFFLDNRQEAKAQAALDVVLFQGVTLSPTIKYMDDFYNLNPATQEGINDRKSLSWGADLGLLASGNLNVVLSYYKEYGDMSEYGISLGRGAACAGAPPAPPGTNTPYLCGPNNQPTYTSSDSAQVDTVSVTVAWAAIPNKLDLDARLALSKSVDQEHLLLTTGALPTGGQFPDDTTWLTHLDTSATYKFDPSWVSSLGWKGDLKAKLRYTWERYEDKNWQNDPVVPFSATQGASFLLLASDNPNYNVQMIAGSLIASW